MTYQNFGIFADTNQFSSSFPDLIYIGGWYEFASSSFFFLFFFSVLLRMQPTSIEVVSILKLKKPIYRELVVSIFFPITITSKLKIFIVLIFFSVLRSQHGHHPSPQFSQSPSPPIPQPAQPTQPTNITSAKINEMK